MKHWKSLAVILAGILLFTTGCNILQQDERKEVVEQTPSSQQIEATTAVESVSMDRYAYSKLPEEAQHVYDEIYDAIYMHKESVTVATLDSNVLNQAYRSVGADYGGLFWVEGYTYTEYTRNGELIGLEFAPKYTMNREERDQVQRQIDERVELLLGGISSEESDYQKARFVFDTLINTVNYDTEATNSQNIISVFINGSTVCQGYACATQYLLELLGIQGTIITGEALGEAHAWNLVRLDGEYYYMDTTWGNSTYLNQDSAQQKYANYSYFAVTSDEMGYTHQPTELFELPVCTATADSYYVEEGHYFTDWEPQAVGALCENIENGAVSMKFADATIYEEAKKYLIDEGHLHDYYQGDLEVFYIEDTDLKVLSFMGK